MEEWKPIKGYEGLYEVSNLGNVRSWMNNRGKKIDTPKKNFNQRIFRSMFE